MGGETSPLHVTTNMFNFKGVTWEAGRKKFMPQIRSPETGKRRTYGRFDSAEAAARKYDELAREFHGKNAVLNFPNEGERGVLNGSAPEVGLCRNGHSYSEHGCTQRNGAIQCRACNRLAVHRYLNKLKAPK